jgi:peptidoglycan hydrolase-like protein with peptidoglycan-binding domain
MALQSRLFRGDPKLEAAASSDPDHITPGAKGSHVGKIQQALIQLDNADIDQDGDYGPATAAAVLAYKQKRNIVNLTYQTQADNIVGKMTMAALDLELLSQQPAPSGLARILPIFPLARRPAQRLASLRDRGSLRLHGQVTTGGPAIDLGLPLGPIPQMQLRTNEIGVFTVLNGEGRRVVCRQSINGLVFDPTKPENQQAGSVAITQKSQILNIRARDAGRTEIVFTGTAANPLGDVGMILSVLPNVFTRVKTFFHFLDGPTGIKTVRTPADLDAILQTMNRIYNDQAGINFVRSGVNPSLKIAGLGSQVPGVRASQFGSTPDMASITAQRQPDTLFNVFFFGKFLLTPNSDGTMSDFLALTSTPPSDTPPLRCCLCRDRQPGDPAVIDPGKTLAHEAGHALGEDDDEQDTSSLMFFSQSAQTDQVIVPLMAQRMLASFKAFPP